MAPELGLGNSVSAEPVSTLILGNTYSVDFDGVDDYVEFSPITFTADVTCSAWVKTTDTTATVVGGAGGDGGSFSNFIYIADDIVYFAAGNAAFATIPFDASLNNDQWNHIVVVKQSGNNVVGYLNGVLQSGTVTYSATLSNTTTVKYLGRREDGVYFTGLMDEVAIFDSALPAAQVSSIYNGGKPQSLASYNPVAWWRMGDNDGGTGSTITDQGSGGNNGTLTNSPDFSTTIP